MAEKGREIRDLLDKISHPLAEVRSRSLRSVVFKLSNGLLSYSELAEEKEFLAGLLEWFNHQEWIMESQVLTLLQQLAQYDSAGRTLVSIGAVEFLSQLRGYCESSLHPFIDDTLEHLLRVPLSSTNVDSNELVESGCSASSFTTEMTTDMGSFQQQSMATTQTPQDTPKSTPTHHIHDSVHVDSYLPSTKHLVSSTNQFLDTELWRGDQIQVELQPMPGVGNCIPTSWSSVDAESQQCTGEERGGGGGGELRGDLQATTRDTDEDFPFPWLRLTVKDCHVLATTQSRLLNPSSDTVLRSCQFIHDVLLEDFPAEIFLQRSSIFKGLLQLCGQGMSSSLPAASYPALLCLWKLTRKLKVRMKSRRDYSMRFRDKLTLSAEDHNIQNSNPTSYDLPTQSQDQLEELTVEMLEQLQSEQVSLDQYCSSVITSTAPLLPGYLNKQLTWTTSDGERLGAGGSSVAAHLAVAMELVSAVVELMGTQRGIAGDKDTLTEVAFVTKSIESIASALSQCLSKWRRLGSSQRKATSPLLQMVCCSTLQLAHSLSRTLQRMNLSEKQGEYPWWTSCSSLGGAVQELMMSGVIAVILPHLQDTLLPLYQLMDSSNARLFCKVNDMARCFHKMAQFLKVTADSDTSIKIGLALDSLEGLWFICNADFISKAVNLSIDVLTSAGAESVEWSNAKLLLVSLLSHGSDEVMETAYQHFVRLLLEVVPEKSEDHTATSSCASSLHHILTDADILGQICRYGAVSRSDTVAQSSRQFLARLLSQKEEGCWSELKQLLLQWIPYIEVSAGEDSKLFESLQVLVSHGKESDHQFQLDKLQCCLRLLFSQCTDLRVWSFTQLTTMIVAQAQQESDQNTRINFVHSSSPLHDLLATPTSTTVHTTLNKSRSFQLEDILKLRHILRSTTMDASLKKMALEQAAIILQDHSLHEQLMEEGFSDDLVGLLSPILDTAPPSTEGDPLISLATPCIQCLSLLANSSHSQRQELASNYKFLLGLFKVCLVNPKDKELLHSTSKLLVSLLFDTVIRFDDGGPKLPSSIGKRLKLPFPVRTYEDTIFSHSTPCPVDQGLLTSEPLLSMLRTHYHVALAGSVNRLLNTYESGDQQLLPVNNSDNKLCIPSHDIKSLKCLLMRLPVDDIAKLSSHQEVIKTMQLASIMVLCSPLVQFKNGYEIDWTKGVEKFLVVQPRTTKDVELLSSVLLFLTRLLSVAVKLYSSAKAPTSTQSSLLEASQLVWLVKVTCHEDAVCVQLVRSYLQDKQRSTQQKSLLWSIVQFYATITDAVFGCGMLGVEELKGIHLGSLCDALCQCVQVAGSPDHHDLARMETALKSILNITSSYHLPTLIGHNIALLLKLVTSLQQVICLFISGQGMAMASFMGKGVVSQTALSLAHLTQNSCSFTLPQGWWHRRMSGTPPKSLAWLNSLLTDRDPKVRYAGYSLLAIFCGRAELIDSVISHWRALDSFGLWGLCLRAALDPTECSLVRQQAFFVLANLSAVCSTERKWSELLSFTSEELSVNSGRALELLLERHKLFSLLLSTIKIQGLAQLKTKLQSAELAVTASNYDDPLPTDPNHSSVNSGNGQHREDNSPPQLHTTHDRRGSEGVIAVYIDCCDPYVISGWCRLVNNLLQTFPDLIGAYVHNYCIVATLTSILEPLFLKQFFQEGIHGSIHLKWCLRMYTDAVDLLKSAIVLKPDSSLSLLTEKEVVLSLGGILSLGNTYMLYTGRNGQTTAEQSSDSDCFHLCTSVLSLMQVMVQKSTPSAKHLIFSVLQMNWRSFIQLLLYSFKQDPYLQSLLHWGLRRHGLTLLNSLLIHCFQPGGRQGAGHQPQGYTALVTNMIRLLDGTADDDEVAKQLATPLGAQLCSVLLQAYEGAGSALTRERWLVGTSLGLLLSSSTSAKQTALKDGLLEVLMEEVKSLHTKLCMESLEDHTHHTRRSKESPTIDKLVAAVNLLRNFQHKSAEVKVACVKGGLPAVIHKMWPSCTVNRLILVSVLKMLCALTAQHPIGRALLATCVKGNNCSLLQSIPKTATHTLTSHSSCISAKTPSPYSETLCAIFSLMANCALSHECRAVFKKTGFLLAFTSLNPKSERALPFTNTRHTAVKLSSLWIKLLVNLSFSSDGQQMIIKQPESVDILLDVYNSNRDAQYYCLLVFRNLCFYGPSKTLLASNENFLSMMSSALDCWSNDKKRVALAASAIWALLYNSAKNRHLLRKAGLYDRLSDLQSSLQAETDSSDVDMELRRRAAMSITQTLNIIAL